MIALNWLNFLYFDYDIVLEPLKKIRVDSKLESESQQYTSMGNSSLLRLNKALGGTWK